MSDHRCEAASAIELRALIERVTGREGATLNEALREATGLRADVARLALDVFALESARQHVEAADACQRRHDELGRENESLRARVADLERAVVANAEPWRDCGAPDAVAGCDCQRCLQSRATRHYADLLSAEARVADLEACAIPAWMIGSTLEIVSHAEHGPHLMHKVEWVHAGRTRLSQSGNYGTTVTEHLTLAAALRAASENT